MKFKYTGVTLDTPYIRALYKWVTYTFKNWKYKQPVLSWEQDLSTKALIQWKKVMIQVAIGHVNKSLDAQGLLSDISDTHIDEVIKAISSNKNTETKQVPDSVKKFLTKYFELVWPIEMRVLVAMKEKGLIDEDGDFGPASEVMEFLKNETSKSHTIPKDEPFDLSL